MTFFSSPYHLAWFLFSMIGLVASMLAARYGRNWYVYGFLGHAIVVIETILVLTLTNGAREVFSVHCIWFNGLMAVLYWMIIANAGPDESGRQ